jgi:hypothetical protein
MAGCTNDLAGFRKVLWRCAPPAFTFLYYRAVTQLPAVKEATVLAIYAYPTTPDYVVIYDRNGRHEVEIEDLPLLGPPLAIGEDGERVKTGEGSSLQAAVDDAIDALPTSGVADDDHIYTVKAFGKRVGTFLGRSTYFATVEVAFGSEGPA